MKNPIAKLLTLSLTSYFLVSTSIFAAQVYKATDAQGNVSYSDKPSGNDAQEITIAPPPKNTASQAGQRNQNLIEKQKKNAKVKQQQNQASEDAKKKQTYEAKVKKLCKTSQENLSLLKETGRRVYTVKPDGEYHYLSEDERKQEIKRLEAQIEQYCQ